MNTPSPSNASFTIKFDLRLVCLALLLVIAAMLALWRPWERNLADARKIAVTGESSVTAIPDQFTFSPYYEKSGDNAKADLEKLGNTIADELKKLGVGENNITLGGSSYDKYYGVVAPDDNSNPEDTVNLQVQVVVETKELAQKVQDYLATTDAKGQLTAQPSFSKTKTKELQDEARKKAIEDARKKAEETASGLGASVGKVISVNDDASQIGYPYPAYDTSDTAARESLPVTPGKQDTTYRIEVTFELK